MNGSSAFWGPAWLSSPFADGVLLGKISYYYSDEAIKLIIFYFEYSSAIFNRHMNNHFGVFYIITRRWRKRPPVDFHKWSVSARSAHAQQERARVLTVREVVLANVRDIVTYLLWATFSWLTAMAHYRVSGKRTKCVFNSCVLQFIMTKKHG